MKKLFLLLILLVVALFFIGTDTFVNPFETWVNKNQSGPYTARLQYAMAGYLYMVGQRQSKAVELYQTAFQLFPGNPNEPEARYRIGLYYESVRNYPKAAAQYQIIIQRWPNIADKLSLAQRIEQFKNYGGG